MKNKRKIEKLCSRVPYLPEHTLVKWKASVTINSNLRVWYLKKSSIYNRIYTLFKRNDFSQEEVREFWISHYYTSRSETKGPTYKSASKMTFLSLLKMFL